MRLPAALLLCAGLLPALVSAGAEVRGIEILLFYNAYRLDVEVSAALARDRGEDPDKSWKIAKQAFNMPSDWPGGIADNSRPGANFHAFTAGTASMGYAKETGVTKVADPWNPTWQEVRDIVKWEPITKGNQYSYGGFNVKTMLGDLAGDQPNSVPGKNGKPTKNKFFDFDNMLAIIGKHCADLAEQRPDIANRYMQNMAELAELAAEGRKKESAGYKIDDIKKALADENKKFDKKNPNSITGAVKTRPAISEHFGRFDQFSPSRTRVEIARVNAKNAGDFQKVLKKYADAYTTASTATNVEAVKAVTDLDAQTRDHIRVGVQQTRLAAAIRTQLGGQPASACNYPGVITSFS